MITQTASTNGRVNVPGRVSVALVTLVASLAFGQEIRAQPVDEWVGEAGTRATRQANTVLIRRGTIRTARLYTDFVFRFEFRLLRPTAEGRVLVRSRFGYGASATSEYGYRIALSGKRAGPDALGRISAAGGGMKEMAHTAPQLSGLPDGWQTCEIRAERNRLNVIVNGIAVTSAEDLDEFTGHIALQLRRGDGIEFRNLLAERLPVAGAPFGRGAVTAREAGVVLPRAVKEKKPFYPREPFDEGIQGAVSLELVVEPDGSVGDIRVARSLHPDLDEAAIAAARGWQFTPGMRAGQVVPVIVTMDISFKKGQ